jgi:hypothetical protein
MTKLKKRAEFLLCPFSNQDALKSVVFRNCDDELCVKRGLTVKVHTFLICTATQDIAVM